MQGLTLLYHAVLVFLAAFHLSLTLGEKNVTFLSDAASLSVEEREIGRTTPPGTCTKAQSTIGRYADK